MKSPGVGIKNRGLKMRRRGYHYRIAAGFLSIVHPTGAAHDYKGTNRTSLTLSKNVKLKKIMDDYSKYPAVNTQ